MPQCNIEELAGACAIQDLKRLARDFVPSDPSPEKVLGQLLELWRTDSSIPEVVANVKTIAARAEMKAYDTSDKEIRSLKISSSADDTDDVKTKINEKELIDIAELQAEISILNGLMAEIPNQPLARLREDQRYEEIYADIEAAREKLKTISPNRASPDIADSLRADLQTLLVKKMISMLPRGTRKSPPSGREMHIPGFSNLDAKSKISVSLGIIRRLAPQDQQAFLQRLAMSLTSSTRNCIS